MDFSIELEKTLDILKKGGTIVYPTETIWGIGCSALEADSVVKVFEIKERAPDKTFVLLVDSMAMLQRYVSYIPLKAANLIAYHVRPLTIVYDNPINLPNHVIADDNSVAIRVTLDPFCKALIHTLDAPLVSTSANISGAPYPKSFDDIHPSIIERADYAVNHRRSEVSKLTPSTIVRILDNEELLFLRK